MNRNSLYRSLSRIAAAAALAAVAAGPAAAGETQQSWQGKARDAWVDGKIEASYALNRYLNPFDIDTRVDRGVVYLSGVVESQIDKDLAEQIARGVSGVTKVRNDLKVDSKTSRAGSGTETDRSFSALVEDATTTARVKFALLENDSTEGLAIDVDSVAGKVSLEGSVASPQERELAERIARNTEGVVQVENRLNVADRS